MIEIDKLGGILFGALSSYHCLNIKHSEDRFVVGCLRSFGYLVLFHVVVFLVPFV